MRISEDKLEDSDKGKIEVAIQETLVWLEATIGMILFRRHLLLVLVVSGTLRGVA